MDYGNNMMNMKFNAKVSSYHLFQIQYIILIFNLLSFLRRELILPSFTCIIFKMINIIGTLLKPSKLLRFSQKNYPRLLWFNEGKSQWALIVTLPIKGKIIFFQVPLTWYRGLDTAVHLSQDGNLYYERPYFSGFTCRERKVIYESFLLHQKFVKFIRWSSIWSKIKI